MRRMGEMIEAILARCKRGLAMLAAALRGRYVRLLEDEVARLRAENRALLNSLLGTAGVPPLSADAPRGPLVNAVRRRSWPQIAMLRELQEQQRRSASASPPVPERWSAPQPPPARM
jgi:hypothetical protein